MLGCAAMGVLLGCSATHVAQPRPGAAPGAQAQPVREGRWEIRGTRLFVRDVGPETAPVVVVVHGGPGGNHLSLRALEALAPRFRVILYDQRGTGESDRFQVASEADLATLSMEENVEDLEALRQRAGQDRITLVGHSWGAGLAVLYAAAHPEHVEKLVVYSGGPEDEPLSKLKSKAHFARLTDEEKARAQQGLAGLQEAVGRGAPQDELDRLFLQVAEVMFPSLYCQRPATGPGAAQGRAGFWASQGVNRYLGAFDRAAFARKLALVKAPALLTWGRCEPSPQERLLYLLDNLPDARLVIFEESGHNAMEEEPALFFGTLNAFLDGQPLPARSFRSRAEVRAAEGAAPDAGS
ncbi:MAG TPA: alpha/beta fold hydrolase [Myxococcota bacterium]|nr:alpha/beta fold hydrolase [Myxococcota bacterium]HRY95071.1 alpha/beta fold hydrolase [Myxococcota bacterium]HSA22086.1 alpha/beta fold hydrolase [Myxococcota bacterium]